MTNTHVVRGAANVEVLDSAGRLIGTAQHAELPTFSDGSYYEVWNIQGIQGQRRRLRMRSEVFDTFLILGRNVDGRLVRLIVNDDQGPFNLDSRINFTLPGRSLT